MAETSVEVSSSPCLQERSALRSSLPVLSPTPLLTSRRPCQSRLQTTSVLSSPSCCNREGPAGRVQKEILLNSEENKEFEITVRQHVLKRRKRLHHSFMTSHRPPMLHRFCFTGISFESIFFFFIVHYCQFQEDLSQEELLSSLDNRNQCSKHALKKLIKVTLAAGVEITSGLVTLCFDI